MNPLNGSDHCIMPRIMSELNDIIAKIPLLPGWAKALSVHLLGLYVVLQILHLILKKFQTPEMRAAILSLRELSGMALHRAARALELPVERPRLSLATSTMIAAIFYVFALIFFGMFGIFLMISATTEIMLLYKRLLGFGIAGGFLIASRWYYASAERLRIALIESWKNLRDKKDF